MFKNLFNNTDKLSATPKNAAVEEDKVAGRRKSTVPKYKKADKVRLSSTDLESFELGPILGTGSFGQVHLATHRKDKVVCAIKMLSKSQIVRTKQVSHIRAEKDILMEVNFPFIVALYGTSQDAECLYFVLQYIRGGEFFTHLRQAGRFSEDTSRFYAAQVLLAFEYLHSLDIIYRDLKPENLLLNDEGNLKITDFGFAKRIEHRTYTLCGTPDYLAPEIILNKGHGKPVDWWALGVLMYEMLAGYPPFYDDEPWGTYQKILDLRLEFPSHFSRAGRDIIRKLLQQDLTKRYGNLKGGSRDLKVHPWFSSCNWSAIVNLEVKPPIVPTVTGESDTSNFDDYSDVGAMEHEFVLSAEDQENFTDF
mmetsp:Transcript_12521/g.43478  ORF Transcript_12521/g.43478 Transcript_12521/m.43478 type:complete len:364 (-) Transcript_12521:105-1196(-)|eukprot:CAMPEP_0183799676 /NCGR_PEP_ID=MMETSP0803_2-20130417/22438_1 /TAXON_ID=195967 /ORGANISM="Crustomastix stigmata, Strain CCMP3273" /LENGTH=363 /DNA_ID=CAMNT_0026044381 /DNA_START=283 /DNA_END=1374 /DNA_ORIENTATION=+